MATAQNVIDATLARYIDPDKTTWADTEILVYINKAVDYIQQLLINRKDILATKTGSISITDGTEAYLLSGTSMTDFIAMWPGSKLDETGVWIVDDFLKPCRYTERVSFYGASEQEPTHYYITATSIGFLPVPDTSYTVSCLYFYKQATLSVGTSMPFNDVFNEAISAFASSMAFARNEQDISNLTQLYNELEKQALGATSARTPIKPVMRNRRR